MLKNLRIRKGKKLYRLTENAVCLIEGVLMVLIVWGGLVALVVLFG